MKYKNPIIPGFHPDPSICRVGDDYYLVTSTFEYFPGIPIFHSRDLLNWELIGHCITRNSQLKLKQGFPNGTGLFAPTIRYSNGLFYVVCTNVSHGEGDDGNFFVWTSDPKGEWSDPIWLDCPGIDPSLFFDDDGKVYYTGTHEEIYLCELDIKTGSIIGEKKKIWGGSGGNNPEGPHIYKINGWYYLLIAEGGTELCHMVTIARSKNIYGPYEGCPRNPVLSNRCTRLPIKAVGHADIVCDQNGSWWSVCLGIRPISYPFRHNLGRETMLVPLKWDDEGWPVYGRDGLLDEVIETDKLPLRNNDDTVQKENDHFYDDFKKPTLDYSWNMIYNPIDSLWKLTDNGVELFGNEVSLSEAKSLAWIGRRQEHHNCIVKTTLTFNREKDGEEAGLSIYMNNRHHYEIALIRMDGRNSLIVRRQIGSLWKIEEMVDYDDDTVELIIEANLKEYILKYKKDNEIKTLGTGETSYLTTEVGGVFTGNYFALYTTGNGNNCRNSAKFKCFEYIAKL